MASYTWPSGSGGGGGVSGVSSLNSLTGDLTLVGGSGITVTPSGSNLTIAATGGGSGTVTSVALAVPSFLSVSGSPITSAGTITLALVTELANVVFAGPATGSAATPTFRSLVSADLPFTIGNLTDTGTDGITVTGGTGSIIGSGVTISQHVADTTHSGYLASADWNTFNGKQSALTIGSLTDTGTDGITITGGTGAVIGSGTVVSQHVSDTTHNGYLSSADWNTFNGKGSGNGSVTSVTFTGDGTILSSTPSSAVTTTGTLTAALKTQNANVVLAGPATGSAANPTFRALVSADLPATLTFIAPTVQNLSSSGTYTTPTSPRSPLYIRIICIGAGGGGSGSSIQASADGGTGTGGATSVFGSSLISAAGGQGGVFNSGTPASGGAVSLGTAKGVAYVGGAGGGVSQVGLDTTGFSAGGYGGGNPLGGFGSGGTANQNGTTAAVGTGGGGGGAGSPADGYAGQGGGAGGYVDGIISSPLSTYFYSVGAGGAIGTAGTGGFTGGMGADGSITVWEYYQ